MYTQHQEILIAVSNEMMRGLFLLKWKFIWLENKFSSVVECEMLLLSFIVGGRNYNHWDTCNPVEHDMCPVDKYTVRVAILVLCRAVQGVTSIPSIMIFSHPLLVICTSLTFFFK